jgi:hypothetical protein
VEQHAGEAELVERALELGGRSVAEERVDAREADEPAGGGGDRFRERVVRGAEVVAGRLRGRRDGAVDPAESSRASSSSTVVEVPKIDSPR